MPSTSKSPVLEHEGAVCAPRAHTKLCVIIGAMKAGTSSLYCQLTTHPEICPCIRKEPSYFTRPSSGSEDLSGFLELFEPLDANQWACEASTNYTKHPTFSNVPERLHAAFPAARLIYLLRHPVDRLLSHYLHNVAQGRERRSFADAVLAGEGHYLHVSRYAQQLRRFLEFFSRDQILVLVFEEYVRQQAETVKRVFEFLGIDDTFVPPNLGEVRNATKHKTRDVWLQHALAGLPGYRFLPWRVRHSVRRRLQTALPEKSAFLDASGYRQLADALRDDMDELEQYLGRRITAWARPTAHQGSHGHVAMPSER